MDLNGLSKIQDSSPDEKLGPFNIVLQGSSLGEVGSTGSFWDAKKHQWVRFYKPFFSKEDADKECKKHNSGLSPGEKSYYGMRYYVTDKLRKSPKKETTVKDSVTFKVKDSDVDKSYGDSWEDPDGYSVIDYCASYRSNAPSYCSKALREAGVSNKQITDFLKQAKNAFMEGKSSPVKELVTGDIVARVGCINGKLDFYLWKKDIVD